jgi:hypothetical protein
MNACDREGLGYTCGLASQLSGDQGTRPWASHAKRAIRVLLCPLIYALPVVTGNPAIPSKGVMSKG